LSSVRDRLERRLAPRLVTSLARVTWPARISARRRRAKGGEGVLELFFAFDDPCSATALCELSERLAGKRVQILMTPVVGRGIPGDPAVEQKRRYAIVDARRLARRRGRTLVRSEPIDPEQTRFLAEWVAAAQQGPSLESFCVAAISRIWLEDEGPLDEAAFAALWLEHLGSGPPSVGGAAAVAEDERLMKRRGPYDVPAAWVHGRWYFAHDRPAQIAQWLDELGWGRG